MNALLKYFAYTGLAIMALFVIAVIAILCLIFA